MIKNKAVGIAYSKRKKLARVANFNWNNYINKWMLMRDFNNRWRFGRLRSYNPNANTITLYSLSNGRFSNTVLPQANQIEIWLIDRWSKIYP